MTYQTINTLGVCDKIETVLTEYGLKYELETKLSGNKDYLVYTFPELKYSVNGDGITPSLRMLNSNDKTAAFRIMLGCIRWVCSNGLCAGDFLYTQRIVHLKGQTLENKISEIPDRVASSLEFLLHDLQSNLTEIAMHTINEKRTIDIIGNLNVSKGVKDQAIYHHFYPRRQEDYTQRGNLWGLWNNVNESLRERSKGFDAIKKNDEILRDIKLLAA